MTAPRVAGADPGTSSLDLLILDDGQVIDQHRFEPLELRHDPTAPVRWLEERQPLALIAGPSGYGLPLVRADLATPAQLAELDLVRPEERGRAGGVTGFSALVRALTTSTLPTLFLPGVIHLPTVPDHRKLQRIDLGTPDKLCVAALALARMGRDTFCLIELGSAFTALLVVQEGQIVDGLGGSSGPPGWGGPGAWDGETAYLLSPLCKRDLFTNGAGSWGEAGRAWLRESLVKSVAGLQAVTPFRSVVLSGRLLQTEPALAEEVAVALQPLGEVCRLEGLPGAWVKEAAQGAALLADGLVGGRQADLVERLALRQAAGSVLDWVRHSRMDGIRAALRLQS